MRPVPRAELGADGALLILLCFREILPLVPLDLEVAAPDSERDAELRPGDVEIDRREGVVCR